MRIDKLKDKVCRFIDVRREEIIALGEDIRTHPELGFKEFRTAEIVARHFQRLGIAHQTELAITGVKGVLPGRRNLATIAYLGELDSVVVGDHPDADPETGAAHACGHHAQIANLIALAYGLVESGVMSELDGDIALMAVPSEEYVDLAWRLKQREKGRIEFLGGKPELVRIGAFDDVQIAMMTHQIGGDNPGRLGVSGACNGCMVKLIRYLGRAAHAGGGPHQGVNALKAAMLGLAAIDANRETFEDKDHIRVHPIITKGGELVNVIPADVRLETYVRGANLEAITETAMKVDRSLKAGALALGAEVEINNLPGYLPLQPHQALADIYLANVRDRLGEKAVVQSHFSGGSTDMGDLTYLIPAIEARAKGCCGSDHAADYMVEDPETAYLLPAKMAAMTIIDLLGNNAERAHKVIGETKPLMKKEQYLSFLRGLAGKERWKEPSTT